MNNKNTIISYIVMIIITIVIILNIDIIITTLPINLINYWKYTFPPLFISMIISYLLIELNINYYLSKIIKYYSIRIMILSFILGFPNNVILLINDLKNKTIKEKDINYLICFTTVCSPIYLINSLNKILGKYAFIGVIIYYLFNIVIYISLRKRLNINNNSLSKYNPNIKAYLLREIPNIFIKLINICAIILFFQMFTSLINNPLLKGLIEFTSGLKELEFININIYKKGIISIMILLFNSLSIHIQLSYYLNEYNINYKLYYITRIILLFLPAQIYFSVFF